MASTVKTTGTCSGETVGGLPRCGAQCLLIAKIGAGAVGGGGEAAAMAGMGGGLVFLYGLRPHRCAGADVEEERKSRAETARGRRETDQAVA